MAQKVPNHVGGSEKEEEEVRRLWNLVTRKRHQVVWRADGYVTVVTRRKFFIPAWMEMRRRQAEGPYERFEQYGYWGVLDSEAP